MSSDPLARLAAALKAEPLYLHEIDALKARTGLGRAVTRALGNMRAAQPVCVNTYLAVHAVRGWDPLTSRAADRDMPPARVAVEWGFVALAVKMARGELGLSQRAYGDFARVTASTVCRVETGQAVSVAGFLRLCAALDRHPHQMMAGAAPECSTGNTHCNTLISHGVAPAPAVVGGAHV